MNINSLKIIFILAAISLFSNNGTHSIRIINSAIAQTTNNFPSSIEKKLSRISRTKQTKVTIEVFLRQLPEGTTPADYFNQNIKPLITLAENHAYPTLIALNKLGVDLKKMDKASKGKLSEIIKRNAAIDSVYGQGGEIAQLENTLGLKQYTQKELDLAIYKNSIYHISIGVPNGSLVWKNRKETLPLKEQYKYLQNANIHPYMHFRPDGIVGLTGLTGISFSRSMGKINYSTGITWDMEGKDLIINWYDGIKFKFKYSPSLIYLQGTSSVKGWRSAISPSWGGSKKKNNNNIHIVSKVAKGESVALNQKKPSVKKEIALQKSTSPITKKQLAGIWETETPSPEGTLSMLEFRPDGLLLAWNKLREKNVRLPFSLYPKNNKPRYFLGTIFTIPKSNGNYFNAAYSPAFNMVFNWSHKDTLGFDDWQLIGNDLLRISHRFYQAKINNEQLILQPYAICPIRLKTVDDCIEKKIITKADKRIIKNWVFKRLDAGQRDEFNTYTTVELLKHLPKSKVAKFKLKTTAKLPEYISLLKSSSHLATKKIPNMLITSHIIPTFHTKRNEYEYRTADDLKLALQLGFGKWLLKEKFQNEVICEIYIRVLSKGKWGAIQKDSRKVLQDYCKSKSTTLNSTKNIYKTTAIVAGTSKLGQGKKDAPFQKLTKNSKTPKAKKTTNSFTDCWNWSNGAHVVINPDGSALNGVVAASWQPIDARQGRYQINWPPFIDTLSITDNGNKLTGSNNIGFPISAIRKSGVASELVGRWLWGNGVMVHVGANSLVVGGGLKGKWSKSGKNWLIEWPIIDDISMSRDRQSLRIKNQFGTATAQRAANCK